MGKIQNNLAINKILLLRKAVNKIQIKNNNQADKLTRAILV